MGETKSALQVVWLLLSVTVSVVCKPFSLDYNFERVQICVSEGVRVVDNVSPTLIIWYISKLLRLSRFPFFRFLSEFGVSRKYTSLFNICDLYSNDLSR